MCLSKLQKLEVKGLVQCIVCHKVQNQTFISFNVTTFLHVNVNSLNFFLPPLSETQFPNGTKNSL